MAISANQLSARAKVTTVKRSDGMVFVHSPILNDGTAVTPAYLTSEARKALGVKEVTVVDSGSNTTPHTRAPHGARWGVFSA